MRLMYPAPVLMFVLLSTPAAAKEVAGVQVPEAATVNGAALALNGAGVRTRFFVKAYVGALYLPSRQTTAEAALAAAGPKSVRLHIVHDISADRLSAALNDGFAENNTPAELERLKDRMQRFTALIPAVHKGDVVRLDLLSDGTTEAWINDAKRGAIAGADFQQALLKIWLGEKPVDKSLKRAMLGQ